MRRPPGTPPCALLLVPAPKLLLHACRPLRGTRCRVGRRAGLPGLLLRAPGGGRRLRGLRGTRALLSGLAPHQEAAVDGALALQEVLADLAAPGVPTILPGAILLLLVVFDLLLGAGAGA